MSINTKIRFGIVASAVVLATAAPAAFALNAGTTYGGIYTEAGGTADAPAARFTQEVMRQTVASSSVSPVTGTTYRGIYTEPGGTADAPAARFTQEVLQKKIVPSGQASINFAARSLPAY